MIRCFKKIKWIQEQEKEKLHSLEYLKFINNKKKEHNTDKAITLLNKYLQNFP